MFKRYEFIDHELVRVSGRVYTLEWSDDLMTGVTNVVAVISNGAACAWTTDVPGDVEFYRVRVELE